MALNLATRWAVYAQIFVLCSSFDSVDLQSSCAKDAGAEVGGSQLLQMHHAKSVVSMLCSTEIGKQAPVTAEGFHDVGDSCCYDDMKDYIRRVIIDLGLTLCDEGGLSGFAPFFSCQGQGTSYFQLRDALQASTPSSGNKCPWLVPASEACAAPDASCGISATNPTERQTLFKGYIGLQAQNKPPALVTSDSVKHAIRYTMARTLEVPGDAVTVTMGTGPIVDVSFLQSSPCTVFASYAVIQTDPPTLEDSAIFHSLQRLNPLDLERVISAEVAIVDSTIGSLEISAFKICKEKGVCVDKSLGVPVTRSSVARQVSTRSKASTFYISPVGSDKKGDGSRGNAYRTLKGLLQKQKQTLVRSGGTIYLRGGTHRWGSEDGRIENLIAGGGGLLITADPQDSIVPTLSGAEEILGPWKQKANFNFAEAQKGTSVWCASMPRIDTNAEPNIWVNEGQGPKLAPMAQLPNVGHLVDAEDWPAPSRMKDRVEPHKDHVWQDSVLRQVFKSVEVTSPPVFCKYQCDKGCEAISGGPGCPKMKSKPKCGENLAWLYDEGLFGDRKKNFVGGFADISLCSFKTMHKDLPIVAHDHKKKRIQVDYTKYACLASRPAKSRTKMEMWDGVNSCWKKGAWALAMKPKFRIKSPAALDRLNEWWIYPKSAGAPEICIRSKKRPAVARNQQPLVLARTRGHALDIVGSENIRVNGLKFFGTEVSAKANWGVGKNIVFESLSLSYPDKIQLKPAALKDSEVRFGHSIEFDGILTKANIVPCRLENTLIEYALNGVMFWNCAGGVAKRNTIRRIRNNNGLQFYFTGDPPPAVAAMKKAKQPYFDVGYNRIHDMGFASQNCDCSGVQTRYGAYKGMQVHNNWMYHLPHHKALRFDTSDNGGDVYQNVCWKTTKGLYIKGGMHEGNMVVHNTGFSNKNFDIYVPPKEMGSKSTTPNKPYNDKTRVFNNAADDYREENDKNPQCTKPICSSPCKANQNSWGQCGWPSVHEMLRDVRVFDFRPRKGSRLDGAASTSWRRFAPAGGEKTIGAYAVGGHQYSIPGKIWEQTSAPVPPHGFPSAVSSQDLMFNQGDGASKHDIFLSRDRCAVFKAPIGSLRDPPKGHPAFEKRLAWPQNVVSLGDLQGGEVYYWRVDAIGGRRGVVKGDIWCFRVSSRDDLEVPWNLATGMHACAKQATGSCGAPITLKPIVAASKPPSKPKPTKPPPVSTGEGDVSCGSQLSQKSLCSGGDITVLSNSAADAADCLSLCEGEAGLGAQGQECCVYDGKNNICRLHAGAFKGPSGGNRRFFAATCSGAGGGGSNNAGNGGSNAGGGGGNIGGGGDGNQNAGNGGSNSASGNEGAQCGSMQQRKACVGGDKVELGLGVADGETCRNLCTKSGEGCCTWNSGQKLCKQHKGDYMLEKGGPSFFSATCSGGDSSNIVNNNGGGGNGGTGGGGTNNAGTSTSNNANGNQGVRCDTMERNKGCYDGDREELATGVEDEDACLKLCSKAGEGCCSWNGGVKSKTCKHHKGDYTFGSGKGLAKIYSAKCYAV